MGSSSSNHNSQHSGKQNLDKNNSKYEGFLYESDYMSSRSSRTERTQSPVHRKKKKNRNKELQLCENVSNKTSGKQMVREDSVMSNFDKLTVKSSRIQKLNEMLDDQIKEHRNDSKQKNRRRGSHSPDKLTKRIKKKRTQAESVILGIWIGITISIVVILVLIVQVNKLSIANESQFSRDFPTWRGIAIWIFYVWMLGFDIWMFDRHRIRYRQIFKIAQNHYPQAVNIYRIAGFHSSMFTILFLFYVLDIADIYKIPGFTEEYFALISWGLFIVFLFLPLPILSNKGRYFVFSLIIDSVLSPFRGVTFPVTWMTDQAVSMAVPLKDLQYTICYYTQLDFKSEYNVCQDSNRISTVLIVAVSICSIRIIQCIRQGYDKGEYFMTPFFFNTLKYAATLCTAVFAFEYKLGADEIQAAWLLFAIISSFYSFVWDLKMDWDLLQKNNHHPFLREKLVLGSANVYYLIMAGNFVMRLAWIITISPKLAAFLGNNNLVFLVTGMIEIFRRGVWNLLRVEKQHLALVNKPPPKNSLLEQKALELEKKLATVQNSLNLQIKMLKFFKKFEDNREHLRTQLQRINEGDLEKNQNLIEVYNQQFQHNEIKQISGLMEQILRTDSFLKTKVENDQSNLTQEDKNIFKQRLLNEQNTEKKLNSQIRQAQQKIKEVEQIKSELKEIQDLQQIQLKKQAQENQRNSWIEKQKQKEEKIFIFQNGEGLTSG